uniref:PUA domain-containing protein n=1 Tax=Chromera velia CCMP2878 TaxID=1169474 RepID=A0A0G4G9J2_9ALVE|eukprot:Cvel_20807.t1-p1 / transcript=Cvel_20807.t1 / gene=Cvel_20807 / organism=Chromera_velia_CCMP2878 / gene_product=Malignant T-cell-amplified sequence 1, putative / transcript_product=Malignant T-cell-amplified sequence 1, putative / location=Cvel_scaffold1901:280-1511(+) / protein_length=90 / sequence_SO=supercontig / SO=protein_coding / is_pseudo=false
MPRMQLDRGGIKFALKGANLMCPGFTSPGGQMEEVEKDAVVQVVAEGKYHACAVGVTTMSTKAIREVNKDVCINSMHFLGDGLWEMTTFA